ncbi:MAG: two-component system sensor histidine kinase KdbD [Planctomycetota bacterium]|nr:MAG: two-component system sensor histidine kinase KdbD [Planctomycetota bacterium]
MTDERPNPDELLAKVQAEESLSARGRLKIFFGMAPGVGKTYAMLEAARKTAKEGTDVVIGYVEPHARPETQALVLGLDVLPRRVVSYGGVTLEEFDLEGALARKPQILIVDELAHTNAPGSTHERRWQDVEQVLAAGIDVYTTLNVQHIESLNDVVAQITGIVVRETVSDAVFERADEIELVDISPDDLLERLREGKVYVPAQAQRAIEHFFQKGNLIALRELAMRQAAERVDAQMGEFRRIHAIDRTWPAAERLLVCVGPSPMSARLIRATRRIAAGLKAPWLAVHVESPPSAALPFADRERLAQHMRLAEQLGGETVTLAGNDVAGEVVAYAREHNVTKIIAGKPQQSRWRDLTRGSYVYELTRRCGDIDVYIISGEGETPAPKAARAQQADRDWFPFLGALGTVAVCTAIGFLMSRHFAPTNIVMVYLLGILAVSLRWGRWPSILSSVLGVAAFDFCFVPPQYTFAVADTEYLFTFAVMLFTGLVISTLTARLGFQAEAARDRERRTAALFATTRELSSLEDRRAIIEAGLRHVTDLLAADACVLTPDAAGRLTQHACGSRGYQPHERENAVARWVLEHGKPAGRGTQTLPAAESLHLPLLAASGAVGVLAVRFPADRPPPAPAQIHLLETLGGLIALSLERAALAHESEQRLIQVEAEKLRSSLLSAVSHDLRTPLAAIAGASSTLLEADRALPPEARRELTQSIVDETDRLNRLVANLLDMTRLEGGAMVVEKQWQGVEEIIGVVLSRLAARLASHRVEVKLPQHLPLVPFDDLLIQQVLVNLLENAVKYAPEDSQITISAKPEPTAVTIEVADEGPGIPAGDEERIFDKFHRGSTAKGRAGVGLGLAICRGIVNLHGGRIWAQNRPQRGAAFRFTLPIEGTPPKLDAVAAASATEQLTG